MSLVFDSTGFQNLHEDVGNLLKKMEESYTSASTFRENVMNSSWEGESKKEFLAFLDLVLQFHAGFYKEKGISPMDLNAKEIGNHVERVENFLKESSIYLNLSRYAEE